MIQSKKCIIFNVSTIKTLPLKVCSTPGINSNPSYCVKGRVEGRPLAILTLGHTLMGPTEVNSRLSE